jgi:hypothetical protein
VESWLPALIVSGIALAVGAVALREHRALRASRRSLISNCLTLLDNGKIEPGPAEFPRLRGKHQGRLIHVDLVPDTMTIRRLPQLWLSVTRLEPLPLEGGIAVLVRPSGNDYFSLTETFTHTLSPPGQLPWEVLVRGETPACQAIANDAADAIASILADPKVKEVAITPKGVRIVRQAAEGRRGEHLLLRQAIFDDADIPREDFDRILAQLCSLSQHVQSLWRSKRAA